MKISILNIKFENKNKYPDSITYGFPIDFIEKEYFDHSAWDFSDDLVPYFRLYLNDKELNIEEQIDFSISLDSLKNMSTYNSLGNFKLYKQKWYISDLFFPEAGIYELKVEYKVKNWGIHNEC